MRIIPRTETGLKPSARAPIKDRLPWPELDLHHSVTGFGEAATVRAIQADHLGRGWRDGGYNHLVTASGQVFEMLGAGNQHLNINRGRSGAICLVGNLETNWMPAPMIDATAWLVAHGALSGWWPLSITAGHRDLAATACPGQHAYALIPEINRRAVGIIEALKASGPLPKPPEPDPLPTPGGTVKVELPILRHGARGGPVKSLQALLVEKAGQRITIDGVYGTGTESAVLNVQRFFGLRADGIVGRDTWGVMFL